MNVHRKTYFKTIENRLQNENNKTRKKFAKELEIVNDMKFSLGQSLIEKVKDMFKKHGILNSSHNVPQRDTPIAEDYSDISIEPGEVKYTAVDDYLEMSYSSIVGSLIYIAITARPDLAFAIGKVSRGMHQPNPRHIAMLKHLLGYLRKTQNFKMVY